jgi:hypothetical protein
MRYHAVYFAFVSSIKITWEYTSNIRKNFVLITTESFQRELSNHGKVPHLTTLYLPEKNICDT